MLRILIRLYLITIVTYSAGIFLFPELILRVFNERYVSYGAGLARGTQSLIVNRFNEVPSEQWPTLVEALNHDFAPQTVRLVAMTDPGLKPRELANLKRGERVIRLGDYGWLQSALAPLNEQWSVEWIIPPDPLDINMLYWGMNVLIGGALLGCLLLWFRPHWRDLERLKRTAARLGQGHLSARTHIPASSNISGLAGVFDDMAQDIEGLLNQQRDLLNAVSHELRTPLTRMDFCLELVLSDELPAASRQRLMEMVSHVRELDELVLELLSYSRLQNPAQQPEQVQVVLEEFIDSILGSFAEELDNRGVCWEVVSAGDLQRFSLDPRLTARAVQNLIRNAMRYCQQGVQVRIEASAERGCLICIDDDGIGIPLAERERIFEPFYRLDRSRDRTTGGFGLGLAISRRAIERQGGSLKAESSPLGGARLRLWLPVFQGVAGNDGRLAENETPR